jgi:uncharacterized protein YceH (UPF0502 family)
MVSKQLRLRRGQKGLLRKVKGRRAPQPDHELNSTTRGRVALNLKTVGLLHFAFLI